MTRDEYPYASTIQGGEINWWRGFVSVRNVPSSEQALHGGQGGLLRESYRGAQIKISTLPDSLFFNTFSYTPSFYIKRNGEVHTYP